MSEEDRPAARRTGRLRPPERRVLLPWSGALVLFIIAVPTAPEVLDVDAVEGGLLPLVAAAAALPFGLITTRPALGWLVSASSALLVSLVFPVIDGDPWPWPIVHGLVLLALLFAVAWRPPAEMGAAQRAVTVLGAWLATMALFGFSVPAAILAGWLLGVTAVVAAGLLMRWLTSGGPAAAGTGAEKLREGWVADLLAGFRAAFVNWVRSPRSGRPLGERRLGNPGWLVWLRAALPWIAAFGVFWIGLASIRETLVVHDFVLPILAALIALPVGLLRDRALLGWRLATVTAVTLAVVGTPTAGPDPGTWPVVLQLIWLAVTFVVSVRHDRWTTVWMWLATVVVISTGVPDNSGTSITLSVAATALVLVGDLIRTRQLAARDLERQAELSELEKARRTVLEERARIARDLHDVVAHHMSMVVVQAESAPFRLPDLSDDAKAELSAISATAREALGEIRGLLGVLRNDDGAVAHAPQPGVDDIAELVDGVARSGVPVTLAVTGSPREIGAAAGLSAYRIVQESLANAVRHAPGSAVRVAVDYGDEALSVRVINAAPQLPAPSRRPGHGLVGMRERAAVVSGALHAGPTPDGGFEVSATLPLDHKEAT